MKPNFYVFFFFLILGFNNNLFAVNKFWTGNTNTDWNTANNWNPVGVPNASDNVYVNGGTGSPVIASGTTVNISSINVSGRTVTINAGGILNLRGDGTEFAYLQMSSNSTVNNNGTISVESAAGGAVRGYIDIDATAQLNNSGLMRVNCSTGYDIQNRGNVINQNCAQIRLAGLGTSTLTGSFINNGYLQTNFCQNVTNNGVIKYESGGLGGANNGSVRVNDNPTNSTIFTYQGTYSGTINGIYKNATATTSAGTFTAPNTFTPSGLSPGQKTLYAKITPSSGGCTYIVPFAYTYVAPPNFTTDPITKTVCSGSGTTFMVAASGSPTYQWQVNTGSGTFNNLSNSTPYSGVTGTMLTISNVTGLSGYQYRCVATNAGGSDNSNVATLTVSTVTVTNPTTTTGTNGTAFIQTFTASGGVTPRSFSLASGTLPTGLNLSSAGTLSGTPTQSGTFPITVRAADANGCTAISAIYTLVINAPIPTIAGLAATPNPACVGSPITFTATVGNVTGSYNFTVTNGTSTTTGTSANTAFSQNLTASGSGVQSFTLIVNDNNQSASLVTTLTITNSPDYQPLVDLYASTGGANWTTKTGWLSGCDPCTGNGGQPWFGLICANGRVREIGLFNNNLVGNLPASLSALTALTRIQINGNAQLGGSIPAGISNLTALTSLELDANALTGTLPASLSALTNLQFLNLANNQLTGGIPSGLGTLTNLIQLILNTNQLTGGIPASLSALTNLNLLELSENQLTGSIPTSLSALNNLQRLSLNNNQLMGSIPASLSALINLQALNLRENQLTGSIPTSLGAITGLQELNLGINQLTGSIPASLGALTSLQALDLSINQLTGSIPASLGALTNLQALFLNINRLSGCFPVSLTALCGGDRIISFFGNPGLPRGGAFTLFCNSGLGSDGFLAQASASPTPVCIGQPVSLSANGGAEYSYSWRAPAGATLSNTSSQSVSATLTSSGVKTFTVVISSGSSCSSSTTVEVTGNEAPVAGLSANGPLTCAQTSVTLTATGGSSYTFTAPDGAVLAGSGATRSVATAGIYSVTVANASGCVSTTSTTVTSTTATVSVTNPTVTTATQGSVFSQNFTASGSSGSYSYSLASGNLPTGLSLNANTGVVSGTPTQNGSFPLTVRATDANGCSGVSTTYDLVVNSSGPTITGFATLNNSVCVGSPITFTAMIGNISGQYGWSLSNGGPPTGSPGLTTVTSFSTVLTASGTGVQTFTLTVTSGGQSTFATTTATVNSLPTAELTNDGPLSCTLTTVTLTASGGTSYTFANGSGTVLAGSGATRSVATAGTYSVTVANASGCVSTTSTTVSQSVTAPSVSITPSSATLTCANPSVSLTAVGTGTVRWSTGATTPVITVNAAATYSVTITNGSGCTATASAVISTDQTAPSVSITPSSALLTCASPAMSLTSVGTGTVRWNTGATTPVITVNLAGTYSVTLTNNNGCTATASAAISADQTAPSVSITPSSATLTCASPSVSLTAVGTGTVRWNTGATTPVITVNAAAIYSVTITNGNGCSATASAAISADQTAPSVSIAPSTTLLTCANPSVSLTAVGTGTVRWSTGATTPVITVNAAGTYSVTITNGSGCTATASTVISTDQNAPSVSITPSSATLTCASPSVNLTAVGTGSVRWSTGAITPVITINTAGTYSVTLTNSNGCTATASAVISTDQTAPSVSITPSSALLTCVNPSVSLTAVGTGTVRWSTGATTPVITVNAAGTYSVTITNGNGCTAAASTVISADQTAPSVSVNGNATLCQGSTISLTATGIGTFRWSTGDNTPNTLVSATGTYSVTLTAPNGCTSQASQLITALSCTTATPPTTACGSPQNTLGQVLTVTGVTDINCQTGAFRILTTGGNNQPINFANIVGLSNVDPYNCVRRVDGPDLIAAINNVSYQLQPFAIRGQQVGGSTSTTFAFDFKAYCTSTSPPSSTTTTPPSSTTSSPVPTGCGSPTSTLGQALVITGVTEVNCVSGAFRILTTGGNGQPINFAGIVGLSNVDPYNCVRMVDTPDLGAAINDPASSVGPFALLGMQVGGGASSPFIFDFKGYCVSLSPPTSTTTAPPTSGTTTPTTPTPTGCGSPNNTIGQPLLIMGVAEVNCATGSFRILTTGGNGEPINFAGLVGLSSVDPYNCVRMVDGPDLVRAINNPGSDVGPFGLRGMQVGGSASSVFMLNLKGYCTGQGRKGVSESANELAVLVLGNPTLGESVEVVVSHTNGESVTLRVSNGQGQAVSQQTVSVTDDTLRERVVLGRSAGVYLLQVSTPTRSRTVKIVRQ